MNIVSILLCNDNPRLKRLSSFEQLNIRSELARFTQLKRYKEFGDFIMLVWDQGPIFHIAIGSHPVQEPGGHKIVCTGTWRSQDSLYRGQIQKLLQCCQKPYRQIPLVITIQKKYSLNYLRGTVS